MILHVLTELAMEVVGGVVGRVGRDVLAAVWPRRPMAPSRPAPKPVIVGAGAMFDRLALYKVWAAGRGLEPTTLRGAELAGTVRGRATEMVTGLVGTPLPRSPEILIRVALSGVESSTLVERDAPPHEDRSLRAMESLLDVAGVRDVGVTRSFVRLRFDAFVETTAFENALAAFEQALSELTRDGASPYR